MRWVLTRASCSPQLLREGEMAKDNKQSEQGATKTAGGVSCSVLSPLKYNGQRYAEGDTVTLPLTLHDELKAAGVVAPANPASPETKKPTE
jgi:hypothetical protein